MQHDALNQEYYEALINTGRGGYKDNIRYDACDLKAHIFHYVCDANGLSLTDTTDLPKHCVSLLRRYTLIARQCASDLGIVIGETCVRIIWYPMQETDGVRHGKHKDFCYLTVPLYDSICRLGKPFYGEMAERMGGVSATPHCFKAYDHCNRTYVVAFVQLPFDTAMPDGRKYVDVLNEVCTKGDSQHTNPYQINSN